MITISIKNKTNQPIHVTGSKGDNWHNSVKPITINKDHTASVGTLSRALSPQDHWGWIYFSIENSSTPNLQLYIADGMSRGIYDHAVQWFDGGNNRNGATLFKTKVTKNHDNIEFEISLVFSPWMKDIPDDKMLHQLTIPGSHDSGTSNLSDISRCQSLTIKDQLFAGVRYFDIRLDAGSTEIVHGGFHGSAKTGIYFGDLAILFHDFLTGKMTFPATQEVIILQIKDDRGTAGQVSDLHQKIINLLEDAFKDHPDKLYLEPIRYPSSAGFNPPPTLKDLRGKLVLIRRYDIDSSEEDAKAGTPVKYFSSGKIYNDWAINPNGKTWIETFTANRLDWPEGGKGEQGDNEGRFNGELVDYRNRHSLSFVIQDKYNITGLGQDICMSKFNLVKHYMEAASQAKSQGSWFLNFSSCTENLETPKDYSDKINEYLRRYFKSNPARQSHCGFGTLLMDFVDADLVRLVYEQNDKKSLQPMPPSGARIA